MRLSNFLSLIGILCAVDALLIAYFTRGADYWWIAISASLAGMLLSFKTSERLSDRGL